MTKPSATLRTPGQSDVAHTRSLHTPFETWQISAESFPAAGTSEEKLWFVAKYAILAPSSHNSQPWLFAIHGNEIELYADLTRRLPVVDPDNRELMMSCGAALFHLRVAAQYFGHASRVETFPDDATPTLLARLHLGFHCDTEAEEVLLFHAIPKRRTNRMAFRQEAVPEILFSTLERDARSEGGWLQNVEGEESRLAVADLVGEADRLQWSDASFRAELAAWMHSNRRPGFDGIPGYAQGAGDFLSYAGPLLVRTFDQGKGQAVKDRDIAIYSPVLAVLGTEGDTRQDWLAAGQALAKILLRARTEEVWASFLNQPVEAPSVRPKLAEAIGRSGYPQVLLRLGYGQDVKPSPRRPLEEVLIRSREARVTLESREE